VVSRETQIPIVAIFGRPNVGKSTLFNRIVGGRPAIVEDRARTTRDRLYGDTEWNGRRFMIVDTGGLEVDPRDPIEAGVQDQARIAIAEADLIVFVVEAITGLTPADEEAAQLLRRAKAPVFVAVNKSDNAKRELEAAVLGYDGLVGSRAIDQHVVNVRAKLPDPGVIRTVRGVGYALDPAAG